MISNEPWKSLVFVVLVLERDFWLVWELRKFSINVFIWRWFCSWRSWRAASFWRMASRSSPTGVVGGTDISKSNLLRSNSDGKGVRPGDPLANSDCDINWKNAFSSKKLGCNSAQISIKISNLSNHYSLWNMIKMRVHDMDLVLSRG